MPCRRSTPTMSIRRCARWKAAALRQSCPRTAVRAVARATSVPALELGAQQRRRVLDDFLGQRTRFPLLEGDGLRPRQIGFEDAELPPGESDVDDVQVGLVVQGERPSVE